MKNRLIAGHSGNGGKAGLLDGIFAVFGAGARRTAAAAVLVGCLSLVFLASGCSRKESSVGTACNPLIVLLSPAHAPSSEAARLFVEKHLSSKSGMKVKVQVAKDPADAIKRFITGMADVGILTNDEYLIARQEGGALADLQVLRRDSRNEYRAALLVRDDSGIAAFPGLAGKKVAFSDQYSFSGFILPSIMLNRAGIKVEPVFTGGHAASAKALLDKSVAAAATYEGMASVHPELMVLEVTGTVPNEPVVSRPELAPGKRQAILTAFLSLTDTAEGKQALAAIADITGFRTASDDIYRSIHELVRGQDKSIYDMVPEGWLIQRIDQPYVMR